MAFSFTFSVNSLQKHGVEDKKDHKIKLHQCAHVNVIVLQLMYNLITNCLNP